MRTTTSALEVLTYLPQLDLVGQGEARSAAHRLWSLGCWSYLHPSCVHSAILMRLQKSDPVFSMCKDIKSPAYNFEPKYRVTMFTREEWTKGPGSPPVVKGIQIHRYTDGSIKQGGGLGPVSMDNPWVGGSVSL